MFHSEGRNLVYKSKRPPTPIASSTGLYRFEFPACGDAAEDTSVGDNDGALVGGDGSVRSVISSSPILLVVLGEDVLGDDISVGCEDGTGELSSGVVGISIPIPSPPVVVSSSRVDKPSVGIMLGALDGRDVVGDDEGFDKGIPVGPIEGDTVGECEGLSDGWEVVGEAVEGEVDGPDEGPSDGDSVGGAVVTGDLGAGCAVGALVGALVQCIVGARVGSLR